MGLPEKLEHCPKCGKDEFWNYDAQQCNNPVHKNKTCIKCNKELRLNSDILFSGSINYVCLNEQCERFGLLTVVYLN